VSLALFFSSLHNILGFPSHGGNEVEWYKLKPCSRPSSVDRNRGREPTEIEGRYKDTGMDMKAFYLWRCVAVSVYCLNLQYSLAQ
jgi:hypothetical protein